MLASAADRATDLFAAFDAWRDAVPPLTPAVAALAEAWPVALDAAQYERAARHGLAGRLGDMQFETVIFDGPRFHSAMHSEDQGGAEVAFLLPALDAEGDVADVVAWIPETGRTATLLGEIGLLGAASLTGPVMEPPMVHESLLDWLLADAEGLFILDAEKAADDLAGLTVAAVDRAAALRLHARFAPHSKRPPQIVVPKARAA